MDEELRLEEMNEELRLVVPAQAGTHFGFSTVGPRLRGDDNSPATQILNPF